AWSVGGPGAHPVGGMIVGHARAASPRQAPYAANAGQFVAVSRGVPPAQVCAPQAAWVIGHLARGMRSDVRRDVACSPTLTTNDVSTGPPAPDTIGVLTAAKR